MPIILNLILFQIGWFSCVLGAANDWPWIGVCAAAIVVALHIARARRPLKEIALIATATALGTAWDSTLVAAGLFSYPVGNVLANTAPVWILAMWTLFATTLNVSLRWLKGRPFLAGLLGAVGGPSAYYAGAEIGAATLVDPVAALAAQAVGWALIMPLLVTLSSRLDGFRPRERDTGEPCLT